MCRSMICHKHYWISSLAPGGFENIFQNVFFKLKSWIDTLSNSCETALRSMPQNPSDDKSTLVQVMAWCRQAASHYLTQCCPRSLSPYGVTRPQWVKYKLASHKNRKSVIQILTKSCQHEFNFTPKHIDFINDTSTTEFLFCTSKVVYINAHWARADIKLK